MFKRKLQSLKATLTMSSDMGSKQTRVAAAHTNSVSVERLDKPKEMNKDTMQHVLPDENATATVGNSLESKNEQGNGSVPSTGTTHNISDKDSQDTPRTDMDITKVEETTKSEPSINSSECPQPSDTSKDVVVCNTKTQHVSATQSTSMPDDSVEDSTPTNQQQEPLTSQTGCEALTQKLEGSPGLIACADEDTQTAPPAKRRRSTRVASVAAAQRLTGLHSKRNGVVFQ